MKVRSHLLHCLMAIERIVLAGEDGRFGRGIVTDWLGLAADGGCGVHRPPRSAPHFWNSSKSE